MGELKLGQAVSFRVNGAPQGDFTGKVRRIDAAANATTRQAAVTIVFDDPAKAPRVAGLFAEGRIETGSRAMLTVPESSVVRAGDSTHVWRVQGTQVAKVTVKLGERAERSGDYPVQGGLADGDRVLRNPGSGLVDGQGIEMAAPVATAAASAAK
jgi:multidrug efflux pump subunit AcrA (membrane-fusion protein)